MNYTISYREKDGTLTITNLLTDSGVSLTGVSHDDAQLVTEVTADIVKTEDPKVVKVKVDRLLQSEHAATFIMLLFWWAHEYLNDLDVEYKRVKDKSNDRDMYPEAWRLYSTHYRKQKLNVERIIKLCF